MPDDHEVASAYVTILPDMEAFLTELASGLDVVNGMSVTIPVHADMAPFTADVAAGLAAINATTATIQVKASTLAADAAVKTTTGLLDKFGNAVPTSTLGVNDKPAEATIAAANAALRAWGAQKVNATIGVSGGGAGAGVPGTTVGGGGGGGNVGPGFWAGLFAGSGKDSISTLLYGDESRSFLQRALSPITALGTLFSAQFGSIGSLAGFGPEHLVTTALGIGGLATGGAIGGGLLAGGALAKEAVGGGADSLVGKTTLSDVKNLTTDYGNLNQAISQYGANSTQAMVAQNALNASMQSISPLAQAAVEKVVHQWANLKTTWRADIGGAESEYAGIMSQVLEVATAYAPRIAQAAQANLGIISAGLKPLFAWIQGPQGVGIFDNLEREFRTQLPTSIHAMSQGFELFLRVLNLASGYTGTFVEHLDSLFTRLNTPSGFDGVSNEVNKLIIDFHTVDDFLKILGKDIAEIFERDAGTATSIIQKMTGALQQLNGWINSTSGNDALKNLFTVHKDELLQLMQVIGETLDSFGKAYLAIAPTLVIIVTDVLRLANAFFTFTQSIPGVGEIVALATGLLIMEIRAHTLTNTLTLLKSGWRVFDGIGTVVIMLGEMTRGLIGVDAAADGTAAASVALNAALGVGLLVGVTAIAVGLYELIHHFGVLRGLILPLVGAIGLLTAAMIALDATTVLASLGAVGDAIAAVATAARSAAAAVGLLDVAAGGLTAVGATIGAGFAVAAVPLAILVGAMIAAHDKAQQIAAEAAKATASVTSLPTSNLTQISTAMSAARTETDHLTSSIAAVHAQITALNGAGLEGQLPGGPVRSIGNPAVGSQLSAISQDQDQLRLYGDEVNDLNAYMAHLRDLSKTLRGNLSDLNDQFHIGDAAVEKLAASLGINLEKKLTIPELVKLRTSFAAMTDSAGSFGNRMKLVAQETSASTAQITQAVEQAASTTKSNFDSFFNVVQGATALAGTTAVSAGNISKFYSTSLTQAQQFTSGITQAMKEGFSPGVIQQIITAGPAQGLPVLEALLKGAVGGSNTAFIQMVTNAQKAISSITNLAVQEAKALAIATAPGASSKVTADYSNAIAGEQALSQNGAAGTAAWQAYVKGLSGGLGEAMAIAKEYGFTIPNQYLPQAKDIAHSSGADAGQALVAGWKVSATQVQASLFELGDTLPKGLTPKLVAGMINSGTTSINALATSLNLTPAQVNALVTQLSNVAATTAASDKSPYSQAGGLLGTAFAAGIQSGVNQYQDILDLTAAGVAQGMLRVAAHSLRSTSPSKESADKIGVPFMQGIVVGMYQGTPELHAAITSIANEALNTGTVAMATAGAAHGAAYNAALSEKIRSTSPVIGIPSAGSITGVNTPTIINPTYRVQVVNAQGMNPAQLSAAVKQALEEHDAELVQMAHGAGGR